MTVSVEEPAQRLSPRAYGATAFVATLLVFVCFAKFGLSAERSLKVAKAANHFRKFSTKRALTAEDTNAYATEIIGSNFSQITKAYEAGMKGDIGQFNAVMERAAEKAAALFFCPVARVWRLLPQLPKKRGRHRNPGGGPAEAAVQ